MKKITFLLLILCGTATAHAQYLKGDGSQIAVKLNLYNTAQLAFSPAAEVRINDYLSFGVGFTQKSFKNNQFQRLVLTVTSLADSSLIGRGNVTDFRLRTFAPELRIYPTGKGGGMKGFYIAPYMRLTRGKSIYTFTDNSNRPYDGVFSINANRFGAMVGYQWRIKNHFVIDWGIGAMQYSRYNLGITAGKINPADYAEVIDGVNKFITDNKLNESPTNLPLINTSLGYNQFFDANGYAKVNLKIPTFGFRSTFSIGYSF